MALPFGRQTSREALEETTRSIKSSLTEGSSRIFGSVMGAKRGLIGGITSTFDQVVNIVGGGEEQEGGPPGAGATAAGSEPPSREETPPAAGGSSKPAKPRPPKPPAPVTRQRSELDSNGAVKQFDNGRVSRQNTVPDAGYASSVGETAPGAGGCVPVGQGAESSGSAEFADGKQRRKIEAKPPLKRRNTNPFMDDYDPSAVEPDYAAEADAGGAKADAGGAKADTATAEAGVKVAPAQRCSEPSEAWNVSKSGVSQGGSGGVQGAPLLPGIPTNKTRESDKGAPAALCAPDCDLLAMTPTSGDVLPAPQIVPERRKDTAAGGGGGGADSDVDSEGTEGCDDQLDEEDHLEEGDGAGMMMLKSGSRNSDQSWGCGAGGGGGDEAELDPVSVECIEFMKSFVQKIFDPSFEITANDKAKFGELCQNGFGRLWFARCINSQRVNNKRVNEETFYALVQFFIIVLFECNEAEDYGPAKTLMNMCFTFHCETSQGSNGGQTKQFLYSFLKDQPIWQSPRFWNAAFFYAVQQERASKPLATSNERKEERRDDLSFQENITFGQLGTFTSNMRAFGLTQDQCLEFIRKQATIANLPPGQVKLLRQSMERWTEHSVQ